MIIMAHSWMTGKGTFERQKWVAKWIEKNKLKIWQTCHEVNIDQTAAYFI